LSHEVQDGAPCLLNSFSERNLDTDGSRLSLSLCPQFLSEELYVNASLASVQHAIKVMKAESKLPCYRVMHVIGRLPKICHWWKVSLPQGATLRGDPAQGEITAMQPCCLAGRAQGRLT